MLGRNELVKVVPMLTKIINTNPAAENNNPSI
jgi:hypothetical protein